MSAALLLASAIVLAQAGGPPTTLITPGAKEGAVKSAPAPTPERGAAELQAPKVPVGSPGQAQRPTPDQSR